MTQSPETFTGRRCLVTGGGGFIGSHLVEELVAAGANVRTLVRYTSRGSRGWWDQLPADRARSVEFIQGDIRDAQTVDRAVAGSDIVFHLAALIAIPYSYEAPDAYVATNLVGSLNVLDAARRNDVRRVIHVSTSEVYGTAQFIPITESHPLRPQSPYAATKSGADQLALSYWSAFGLPVVVVRPFNTYGPRQSLRAVIPTIAAQLIAGGPVRLGATTPTRDFTFVADTVSALLRAGAADGIEGRTIHLGTGSEISIGALAELIAKKVGRPLRIERDDARVRPPGSEVERLVSDPSLARSLLAWEPRIGLEEGLVRTIEWLKKSDLPAASEGYVR